MDVNANPLFNADVSDVESSSTSSTSSTSIDGDSYTTPAKTTPQVAVLQTANIKNHVPVELDIAESNYMEWTCFFDAFVGKFGLNNHLTTPPTPANRHDLDWIMRDQFILSWLYNSISKDVGAIVRSPKAMAFTIWNAIHDQFRDNELHCAAYLEA
ncbi:uncharacterized protein [Miscanthus floridulus]|uniref:uncharacterized protein n=1 Tax=Miscanthus floridulus TaxID=154761 RepID=UPI0034580956